MMERLGRNGLHGSQHGWHAWSPLHAARPTRVQVRVYRIRQQGSADAHSMQVQVEEETWLRWIDKLAAAFQTAKLSAHRSSVRKPSVTQVTPSS
jgi:hypothetical protein